MERLTDDIKAKLTSYAALVDAWNQKINLTSRADSPWEFWDRHIEDSLQVVPLLPTRPSRIADLGSGAGLPGLVVAIAAAHHHLDLVEIDRRKAAFLREALRILGLDNVTVHNERAEDVCLVPLHVCLARAVAPLGRLLGLAAPLLAPAGTCVFLKGRMANQELAAARQNWRIQVESFSSRTSVDGVILKISEIQRL